MFSPQACREGVPGELTWHHSTSAEIISRKNKTKKQMKQKQTSPFCHPPPTFLCSVAGLPFVKPCFCILLLPRLLLAPSTRISLCPSHPRSATCRRRRLRTDPTPSGPRVGLRDGPCPAHQGTVLPGTSHPPCPPPARGIRGPPGRSQKLPPQLSAPGTTGPGGNYRTGTRFPSPCPLRWIPGLRAIGLGARSAWTTKW